MKWFYSVLGILLAAFGTLWTLQGINVLKGGQIQYAVLGVAALTIGILLLIAGIHRHTMAS